MNPPLNPGDNRRSAWSRYWASGALESIPGCSGTLEPSTLLEFWKDSFALVQDGASVLDLATGNGAVPRLLLRERPELKQINCDAVDSADIKPTDSSRLGLDSQVRFHAGVDISRLPFHAQTYDLITSQFGMEYADVDAAVGEIARVLKPFGELRLVVHHRDSVMVNNAIAECEHIEWLLGENGMLALARSLIWPLAGESPGEFEGLLLKRWGADGVAERYGHTIRQANSRVATMRCADVLSEVGDACRQIFNLASSGDVAFALASSKVLGEELKLNLMRLHDLRRSAMGASQMDRLMTQFRRVGIASHASILSHESDVLAWGVQGRKTGA